MSEGFARVGQLSDFPAGSKKKVQVDVEDVLVANVDGRLYAISNKCTHRGAPLDEGEIEGTVVVCPWHSGRFDITTGRALKPPPTKDEACFEVRIQGTDVLVRKK